MDPIAAFLLSLGIWIILSEVILPNLATSQTELPRNPNQSRRNEAARPYRELEPRHTASLQ
jgi:hypothetical protein